MSNTPNTPKPPYDRNENSPMGKIAIGFYKWMNGTSMSHSVPIEIKYRMYIDQLNAKEKRQ